MNLNEFQELSKRTMPYNGEPANQVEFESMLGNYAMGLVGEHFEFSLACHKDDVQEIYKESGDVLHYCAGLLSCLGEKVDYQTIYEIELNATNLAKALADILEIPKKHIYHRHDLNKKQLVEAVHTIIKMFIESTEKGQLIEIMQMNIDKLKTRYPESFNTADSINRVDVASNK